MSGRAKLTQSKARDGLFDRVSLAGEAQGEQVRKEMQVKGFKEFLLRGNVVDLAVAVVIGAAFGAIVTAFVKDLLTPLIAAIGGQPDFSGLYFTINNSKFLFGDFINAVVSFVIIAAVVYFFVVLPINKLIQLSRKEPPADPTTRKCPYCLSTIPIAATRCAYCTSQIEVPSVQSASAG